MKSKYAQYQEKLENLENIDYNKREE